GSAVLGGIGQQEQRDRMQAAVARLGPQGDATGSLGPLAESVIVHAQRHALVLHQAGRRGGQVVGEGAMALVGAEQQQPLLRQGTETVE
ncbi:MAG: hypothetical protein ACK56I_29360, partial [bacterium]